MTRRGGGRHVMGSARRSPVQFTEEREPGPARHGTAGYQPTYVQCPASAGTKLLHDLFPPVIASVSTCGVQDSSDSPAPDTAPSHLSYNSVRLPSVSRPEE